MTEPDDIDRLTFDVFLLAVRVMVRAFAIDAPATEFERPWQLLREIADGSTTLASPAELAAKYPALTDLVYDSVNRVIEGDRELSRRVLRGLGTSL